MIEKKDIEKLASLSRIKLDEAEKEALQKEMDSILGYVAEIQKVSSGKPSTEKLDHRNVFREDDNAHNSGLFTEILLHEAPDREGTNLKVKKIL